MSSVLAREELQRDIALIKLLLNTQLKSILRSEHLQVSGVKSALQTRIILYLQQLHAAGDVDRLARVRNTIREIRGGGSGAAAAAAAAAAGATPSQSPPYGQHPTAAYVHHPSSSYSTPVPSSSFQHGRLSFKDSPFHTIIEPLTPIGECKIRETTRDTVELKLVLSPGTAQRLATEPDLRILVYCTADSGLTPFMKSEIAFPQQVELKVNFDSVPAKLRGLKNKPGTTNPADITGWIRKKGGYPNKIDLIYALTTKRYFVVANLVQRHPVDELVKRLRSRVITAQQVLQEMRSRADDADIVTTSSVMSLKCPISACRIVNPCRSTICTHNQCFDAESFLLLQEQAPTWTCPVCNKTTTYESLLIDQYVDTILKSTDKDTEQVTIEPTGEWSIHGDGAVVALPPPQPTTPAATTSTPRNHTTTTASDTATATASDDSDIQVLEIPSSDDDRPITLPPLPQSLQHMKQEDRSEDSAGTPLGGISSQIPAQSMSMSQSQTPSRAGAKRGYSEVIDLTLDSDDDDAGANTTTTTTTNNTNNNAWARRTAEEEEEEEEDEEPIRAPKRVHAEPPMYRTNDATTPSATSTASGAPSVPVSFRIPAGFRGSVVNGSGVSSGSSGSIPLPTQTQAQAQAQAQTMAQGPAPSLSIQQHQHQHQHQQPPQPPQSSSSSTWYSTNEYA